METPRILCPACGRNLPQPTDGRICLHGTIEGRISRVPPCEASGKTLAQAAMDAHRPGLPPGGGQSDLF